MAFSDKGKCINLTSKVKDGILQWKAPKGNWQLIAAFCGKTFQKVKRAAPGGEGYVMDHLSGRAVKNYLNRFERAFEASGAPYPHNFFNDSYEVYKADWTENLFDDLPHAADINWKNIFRNFCRINVRIWFPGLFPTTGRRLPNYF